MKRSYEKLDTAYWNAQRRQTVKLLNRLVRVMETYRLRAGFSELITDMYLTGTRYAIEVTTDIEAQMLRELLEDKDKDIPAGLIEPRKQIINQIIKQL